MDKLNKKWLKGNRNFYFRYKYKVIESKIVGSCLNVGCGEHKIKGARNVDYPSVDATSLPCGNNSWDTVILSDVLEHLNYFDAQLALFEAYRVANKKVIITVPAMMSLWSNYDTLLGHFRRYKKGELGLYLQFNGIQSYSETYMFGLLYPLFYIRKFTSGKTPILPKWIDWCLYQLSKIKLPWGSTLLVEIDKC